MPVYSLNPDLPGFPDPARSDRNGLLAVGGKLNPEWLIEAYSAGVFPWFNESDPIMWWSPNPRSVVYPGEVKISKSMKQLLNNGRFELRVDSSFESVIQQCRAIKRKDQDDTWITEEVKKAFIEMHRIGLAHSFETWYNEVLVGGLYGISLGTIFFGESMFSTVPNASKFAFISLSEILKKNSFVLIDCQIPNPHLTSMGCFDMRKKEYLKILWKNDPEKTIIGNWNELLNF
ncbi:MAG: leucyl/phenylalanyl-tRNA--protein transferase [Saprospiraceae bacterium]|nr:leucyl/phenylalanyl-tRNA--protein transferase [Saprospiraceae bacterium]